MADRPKVAIFATGGAIAGPMRPATTLSADRQMNFFNAMNVS